MDQEAGNVGAVSEEPRSPDELRREIEETRAELGDTAAALGAKADVKGRATQRVHEIKDNVAAKSPPSAGGAAATVRANPVPTVAVGALLAGFALGRLVASRRG